jgi:sugar phosphate isomerase/epimerase
MKSEKVVFVPPRHPVPMSLCLFTDGLRRLEFEEMLDACISMGIEALELGSGAYSVAPHLHVDNLLADETTRKKYVEAVENRGLKSAAFNCSGNPVCPGKLGKRHREDMDKTMELAQLMGVKTIVAQSGLPAGGPNDEYPNWITHTFPPSCSEIMEYQWEVTIAYWKETAKKAKEYGIEKIALENHPYNMVFNVSTIRRLRNAVGPIIGLNLDPSHMFFMGGDPILVAEELCKDNCILHVHGKDSRINPVLKGLEAIELHGYDDDAHLRCWNYVAVGYGHDHLWWKEFFGTFVAGGYCGPVSIEVEDPLMPNNEIAIRKSAEFLLNTMLK